MKIAKMEDQTSLHCTKCHQFTRAVAENIPNDSRSACCTRRSTSAWAVTR